MERLHFDKQTSVDDWELGIHIARYAVVAELCRGKRVLDIACGEGYGAHLIATRWGAASVDAFDISEEALAAGRSTFADSRISWHQANADLINPADFKFKYDVIISLETIEHIEHPERFIRVLASILAPGGVLCVSCPNDGWYYGAGVTHNQYHRHVWSFDQFREMADRATGSRGHYLIGSTIKGICSTPYKSSDTINAQIDTAHRISNVHRGQTLFFDPHTTTHASPDESLYFVGLWGDGAQKALVPTAASAAVSPERLSTIQHSRPPKVPNRSKPVIVLAADIPGWAYCNIAQNVKRFLGSSFDIQIVYLGHYNHWSEFYFDAFWQREASLVHVFWREFLHETCLADLAYEVNKRFKVDPNVFLQRFADTAITTSVYDHLHVDHASMVARELLFSLVDAYFVSSEKLFSLYAKQLHNAPDLTIEDGVDPDLFTPSNLQRLSDDKRPLIVGWAGNSAWCKNDQYDPKGFHTVLLPALDLLRKQGVPVEGVFADAAQVKRPRSEMVHYYNTIDVYVCVSEIEGTPNPVLESMSCGVPVISTDVGIIPQVFGPEQRRFILPERTPEALAQAIKSLHDNRELLTLLSQENLSRIQNWSWQHKMSKWLSLFQLALSRLNSRSILRKKYLLMGGQIVPSDEHSLRGILSEQKLLLGAQSEKIHALETIVAERDRLISDLFNEREQLRRALQDNRQGPPVLQASGNSD